MSRPTRARGLKRATDCLVIMDAAVAPHAGAWIETRLTRRYWPSLEIR